MVVMVLTNLQSKLTVHIVDQRSLHKRTMHLLPSPGFRRIPFQAQSYMILKHMENKRCIKLMGTIDLGSEIPQNINLDVSFEN